MKKFSIIFSFFIAITIKASAQFPNNGFEYWTSIGNCLELSAWFTINMDDTNCSYFPVTRSADHYPVSVGSYSLR